MPLRFNLFTAPGSGTNPGQGTLATSVSASGDNIVGYYYDSTSTLHSFDDQNGTFTTLPLVSGVTPIANGVNDNQNSVSDLRQIVGYYTTASNHGFVYAGPHYAPTDYHAIDDPHADAIVGTQAFGINDRGEVVGQYFDGSTFHGFDDRPSVGGMRLFDDIDPPGSTMTAAYGINSASVIVGAYTSGGTSHGFIDTNGSFTTLDDPLADSGGTFALGINDHNEVVGYYMLGGLKHSFLWRNGVFTDLEQSAQDLDIFTSVAGGITDGGQIVGYARQNGTAETLGFITSALHQAPDDFSGDNRSDLLWRQSGGGLALWQMNGAGIVSGVPVTSGGNPVAPDSSWSIVGIGNFFFNSRISFNPTADAMWRQNGGGLALWTVDAASGAIQSFAVTDSANNVVAPDSSWSVVGASDFTGDGTTDVLWRQSGAGLSLWQMDGRTIMGSSSVSYQGNAVTPDASWSIAATGDFTGDGKADILWRQSSSGTLALWQMNGATVSQSSAITYGGGAVAPDSSWTIAGVGDFDGDGHVDVLWRQAATGSLAEWLMNGSTIMAAAAPTFHSFQGTVVNPDSSWSIVEFGDFNNDGNTDILWRQSTTGSLSEWLMNATTIMASGTINAAPDGSWQVQSKPASFI